MRDERAEDLGEVRARAREAVETFETQATEILELAKRIEDLTDGTRHDPALQPGTDRGQGQQAQARKAFDVRARQVRSVEALRTLRRELKD